MTCAVDIEVSLTLNSYDDKYNKK